MIDTEALAFLRCPISPGRDVELVVEDDQLLCSCCRVRFATPDGIPTMIVEEAILPEGCRSIEQLPCRRAPTGTA
jgi:uncharacterized protein YbaR (Trm112 family)